MTTISVPSCPGYKQRNIDSLFLRLNVAVRSDGILNFSGLTLDCFFFTALFSD